MYSRYESANWKKPGGASTRKRRENTGNEGIVIPVTGGGGSHSQMAMRLSALCAGHPLPPGILLVLAESTPGQ
jgi:hypothetical protein